MVYFPVFKSIELEDGKPRVLAAADMLCLHPRKGDPDARRVRVVSPGVREPQADRVFRVVAHEDAVIERKERDLNAGTMQRA